MDARPAGFEHALGLARLRLHRDATPTAMAAAALGGTVIAWMATGVLSDVARTGWLVALAAVLVLRLALRHAHSRAPEADVSVWLWRYRAVILLHGVLWGAMAAALVHAAPAPVLDNALVLLAALCGAALMSAAFDLRAGLMFVLPVAAPLVLHLARGGSGDASLLLVSVTALVVVVGGVRRHEASVHEAVRARLAEQHRAEDAERLFADAERARRERADQGELQRQLLQTTSQGYWFIDTEGCTTDVNPAMCTMLGHPRETVMSRRASEFFGPEGRAVLERELARRRAGATGSYEIDIVRPDGSRLHCVNNATPLFDSDGRPVGSVGLWTDITTQKRIAQALRTHEWLVNAVTDPVSVIDAEGRYLVVNDAWCAASGVRRVAAVGRPVAEVLGPSRFSQAHAQALAACLSSRRPTTVRSRVPVTGRGERLLESVYYPYHDAASGIECVGAMSRDVTVETRALALMQASEAEQRALLAAFPGHIGRLDERMRFTYVNDRLAALMGRHAEPTADAPLEALFSAVQAQQVREAAARVLAGEVVTLERRDDTEGAAGDLQITLAAGPDPHSGRPAVYAFGTDITPLKRAEREMAAARDEAERANRAKSQFLAQMSHELRTPMNAIVGFGQLLQDDPHHPLAPHQRAWVRELLAGAHHLLGLLNELLDLGRIDGGQMPVQSVPVALAPLADDCLGLLRPLALANGVRLRADAGMQDAVRADPVRLKQVLLNLVGNAVKYNRPGGEVRVHARRQGDDVTLSVSDTGPGLTPEQVARLFQPFERLGAEARGIEGTGIGLALCRRLVEAMGGRIGVDSRVGKGSTFWVALPGAPAPPWLPAPASAVLDTPSARPDAEDDAAAHAAEPATSRVLYIEDNAVNVALMEAMLARLPGLHLRCAALPEDGLRLARARTPDLILMDIQMPGMDGFEVLRHLRADPATARVPVVAVSANVMSTDIDAALQAGFVAYLTKPLAMDTLLATVRTLLREAATASA